MKLLIKGMRGAEVIRLQKLLNIVADGIFGPATEKAVMRYQLSKQLTVDGIVGNNTWQMLTISKGDNEAIDEDTDITNQYFNTNFNQQIHRYYLDEKQYLNKPGKNEYCFLHHTAGREDPYKVIDHWNRDSRGRVATEFVIGGQSHKNGDDSYDGIVVQAFPESGYGWHLGKTGSGYMNRHSIGIEICSAGYLKLDPASNVYKTYFNSSVIDSQSIKLESPFRKRIAWHKYSDKQMEEVGKLLEHIQERDGIDMRLGLRQWIKQDGPVKAFGFQEDAYRGKVKGLITHTNVRRDKSDCYPDERLIDIILSL